MYIDIPSLINLSNVPGIGSMKMRSLIAKFKSVDAIYKAPINELTTADGVDIKTAQQIKKFTDFDIGKKQYDDALKLGAEIITFWDIKYPANLKKIYDPPVILYLRGQLNELDKYSISIVGTRAPSSYGKIITEKISRELAQKGITVVSGLARGIDTIAHHSVVNEASRTIAIIGTGVDVTYPSENKKLVEEIVLNGAIVSELPIGAPPDAVNFPRRNRIIAGFSLGTVVAEAGEKSGALITANLALEYNREVFAIPGNINSAKSRGCNQLIKEGAKLVTSIDDILEELLPHFKKLNIQQKTKNKEIDLSAQEKEILNNLSETPIHIDELARKINKATGEILSCLLTLEFKNLVKQLPGTLFTKTF